MKKGLTMLVAAMVIFALVSIIGSAAATTEAAIGSAAAEMIGVALIVTIGAVIFLRWKAKKSPDYKAGRSVKVLNAVVLMVLTAVNARHTHMMHARVFTSPRVAYRTYENKTQD